MAGHYKSLKRKVDGVVNHITDDFSDFSLSSPATKIRRLDAELPPIIEEDDEILNAPNDERALVLFKPIVHSPSSFSLTLNSDLISEIKNNQLSWSKQCDSSSDYYKDNNNNRHLAIVPWVPQASTSSSHNFEDSEYRNSNTNSMELMEADEMGEVHEEEDGAAMMDVEQEDNNNNNSSSNFNYPTMLNLHQQVDGFQQHCLLPQIPQNTSTPISWTS
ncbi:hypothetical protein QL285_072571 [Trifolium repens]|nr:hypothetical protein QL285_072571 [Trifolium repens]